MPYNKSKHVVVRMQRYLDDMSLNRKNLSWPADNPEKLAGRIREAFHAVKFHPEYKQYHNLKPFFRIRAGTGYVEAEYVGPLGSAQETYTPEAMTIPEVEDVNGVVGACIKFGVKADELRFPHARLTEGECQAVYTWGRGEHPRWSLINHEEAGITMTRRRGVDEVFLWRPKENDD